jgi:hypothetical protein
VPVAVYFLLTGAVWEGSVLIAYGALVISLVDNLVRPILVGADTKMPDYVVLISTLGGLELTHTIFGRNEPAMIHYHRSLRAALGLPLDGQVREAAE